MLRPDAKAPYRIVMPRSAHAAFDKAAHYQGLELVRVPIGVDLRADVAALEAAVTPNTIMIVGSALCWGFGLVDPIPEIAAVAERHGLWLHVDCYVGGFLLPFMERLGVELPVFDFRLPAVCSISADLHKHGYAAKRASTVSYRSQEFLDFHHVGVAIDDLWMQQGIVDQRVRPSSRQENGHYERMHRAEPSTGTQSRLAIPGSDLARLSVCAGCAPWRLAHNQSSTPGSLWRTCTPQARTSARS